MTEAEGFVCDAIAAGERAMRRAAWQEARDCFDTAIRRHPTPEAFEALGWACWWQDDFHAVVQARETAFQLYRQAKNDVGAARVAIWLASDYCDFRGEAAISGGWLRRAETLLKPLEETSEHGWLRLIEADTALTFEVDIERAKAASAAALDIGRRSGDADLKMMSAAVHGFALVCEGDVRSGIRWLDEAATAATSGELSRQSAPIWILCYLIYSCEQVRDFDRAAQWCQKMREVADRLQFLFPRGICRVHYAGVLILRGHWREAESELVEAENLFASIRPPWTVESRVRQGELRLRQGRFDEAEAIFRELDWHPRALLGLAELALETGSPRDAEEICARLLRQLPESARFQRADVLELVVRTSALLGDCARLTEALDDLRVLSDRAATLPMQAAWHFSAAMDAISARDFGRARDCLEDATTLFDRAGTPYEAARARLELAMVLVSLGRLKRARTEATKACEGLERLGSRFQARRGRALLRDVERRLLQMTAEGGGSRPALTARQAEVLRLITAGSSDRQIAAALGLSEHTVHRHVANILTRLAVPSRAAAAAFAASRNLL